MKIQFAFVVLLILASVAVPASESQLGSIDFPNSGAPEAQEAFTRAVLLLGHAAEARAQFEIALQRAPRRSRSLAGLARAARGERPR